MWVLSGLDCFRLLPWLMVLVGYDDLVLVFVCWGFYRVIMFVLFGGLVFRGFGVIRFVLSVRLFACWLLFCVCLIMFVCVCDSLDLACLFWFDWLRYLNYRCICCFDCCLIRGCLVN